MLPTARNSDCQFCRVRLQKSAEAGDRPRCFMNDRSCDIDGRRRSCDRSPQVAGCKAARVRINVNHTGVRLTLDPTRSASSGDAVVRISPQGRFDTSAVWCWSECGQDNGARSVTCRGAGCRPWWAATRGTHHKTGPAGHDHVSPAVVCCIACPPNYRRPNGSAAPRGPAGLIGNPGDTRCPRPAARPVRRSSSGLARVLAWLTLADQPGQAGVVGSRHVLRGQWRPPRGTGQRSCPVHQHRPGPSTHRTRQAGRSTRTTARTPASSDSTIAHAWTPDVEPMKGRVGGGDTNWNVTFLIHRPM